MSQELTIDDQLLTWFHYWGITHPVKIEEEAKELILAAISNEDVIKVTVDSEGALIIETD